MKAPETERVIGQDSEGKAGTPDQLEYNQCQEAVKKLTEYLSHELRDDEETEVKRHLSQCRGCFAKFHFEETLLRTIRDRAEQVRAPGVLRDKIMSLLARPSNTPSEP
jgi:anti-sigma factor (TIGR02949 family)